jgi:hypothetical protein
MFAADQAGDTPRITKTEKFEFTGGATIQLKNSVGELDVEGWDRPDVELTTIKWPRENQPREAGVKMLDRVHVTAAPQGNNLVIASDYPKHKAITWPFHLEPDFNLEYQIRAPRAAKLVIDHGMGQVNIRDMTGDIHITNHNGDIALLLPDGKYAIDAKSGIGSVVSDFDGKERREHWFGHQFQGDDASTKLYLRIGFGDILILKMRQPKVPN